MKFSSVLTTGSPDKSEPTNYLTQGSVIEYVPSITERTTGLLKNSGRLVHKEKYATIHAEKKQMLDVRG